MCLSQVQTVSVADVHDMGVVVLAGVTVTLVTVPLVLEVAGPVQCLKRGPPTAHVLTECQQPVWGPL